MIQIKIKEPDNNKLGIFQFLGNFLFISFLALFEYISSSFFFLWIGFILTINYLSYISIKFVKEKKK